MRGAAMSLSAAASGFVVFLLSVSVVQCENDWGVTYTSTQICALKGSTVDISCTYIYPSRIKGRNTKVEKKVWFTRASNNLYVDIKTDPEYSGRVQYICGNNDCTLRITDLRESDSAEYKFRFITNQPGGRYFGRHGITLSVTDLQVQVSRSQVYESHSCAELKCHSSCRLPDHLHYVWYKNGQKIQGDTSYFYSNNASCADSYSCAVEGHEKFPSPPLYAPRVPSVSVSPSGEIVEGSSVNLTCSSDANPAANYTWYKEDEDSPKASGQIFTITDFRPEHSGNYYCEAQNRRGRHNSTIHLIVVAGAKGAGGKLAAAGTISVVLLAIISLSVFLWIRKKRASKEPSDPEERADNREQLRIQHVGEVEGQPEEQEDLQYASIRLSNNQADPLYSNIRAARPLRHMEQQEVIEYAAVSFDRASTAPGSRSQETGDSAALYSTVNNI